MDIFVLLGWLIQAYIWLIMFPYAILSWFRIEPGSVWARIQYFLYRATEPVLRPVRQVIRPMGGLDFSFLVVIIVAEILVYRVLWA
ncbi:MAG TPA: YggT family protein [Acidimicrobiales bacterium]|nr:YggT family protein [Acidimicrobiales bacterium]